MIEDRGNCGDEEEQHLGDEPLSAATQIAGAKPACCKERDEEEHSRDAARDGQMQRAREKIAEKPNGNDEQNLQQETAAKFDEDRSREFDWSHCVFLD
jgi:hypothetical protein